MSSEHDVAYVLDAKTVTACHNERYLLLMNLGGGLYIATLAGALLPAPVFVVYAGEERRQTPRDAIESGSPVVSPVLTSA